MATTVSTDLNELVNAALKKLAYFDLRPQLFFDSVAEVDSTDTTNRGSTIKFPFFADMAAQTSPLAETADVTPVTLTDTNVTVTLAEYGAAVETSGFLRGVSYLEVNPIVAEILGYNAGLSVDTIARAIVQAGTNVVYSVAGAPATTGTEAARNRLAITDNMSASLVRFAVAKLDGANVRRFGGVYKGFIHPDAAYDLMNAAPGNNWSDPHVYVDTSGIYNGVIGTFGGVQWMQTPRAPLFADAGNGLGAAGTIDAYGTIVCGHEALAKGFSTGDDYGPDPAMVQRQPTDHLLRLRSAGWKHLVGYSIFRQACIWRIEAASSIGAN